MAEDPMSEEEAIQRLRRLKEASAHMMNPALEVGRRWAMADAHPDELERLERHYARHLEPAGRLPGDSTHQAVMQHVREIAAAVLTPPGGASDQDQWKRFWRERSGLDPNTRPTPAAIYSFCRGAAEFWRGVRDKL